MGGELWIKVFDTIDKKEFDKKWKKLVDKEIVKVIAEYIKDQAKVDDKKFPVNKNKNEPEKEAKYYPNLYITKGRDNQYYVSDNKKWHKLTKKYTMDELFYSSNTNAPFFRRENPASKSEPYELFVYSGIAYSFGNPPKEYAQYKFVEPKGIKSIKDAENYICKNHQKWSPALAIVVNGKTVVGGWASA